MTDRFKGNPPSYTIAELLAAGDALRLALSGHGADASLGACAEWDAAIERIDEEQTTSNEARYLWLRDVATPTQRDTALGVPCTLTPDEPGYADAHASAVDAEIDRMMAE